MTSNVRLCVCCCIILFVLLVLHAYKIGIMIDDASLVPAVLDTNMLNMFAVKCMKHRCALIDNAPPETSLQKLLLLCATQSRLRILSATSRISLR